MRGFDFDRAIFQSPGKSVTRGLRDHDGPSPIFEAIVEEHIAYAEALVSAGVTIDVLPPLEEYPDAVFVEEPAPTFPEGAILLRPATATRMGEAALLKFALERHFPVVTTLAKGHADGGDVLVTPGLVQIGLSSWTDLVGADALSKALQAFGRPARIVIPPSGALHLKTAVSLLDEETVLTTAAGEASELFNQFRQLIVAKDEEAAANALRVNARVFVGAQFASTAEMLDSAGYAVVPLATRQISMIDAGLSCISLLWPKRAAQ